jgi:hypothetical protein
LAVLDPLSLLNHVADDDHLVDPLVWKALERRPQVLDVFVDVGDEAKPHVDRAGSYLVESGVRANEPL